ncbi:hypothetical protein [Actinokineospora pegani]|uniref:hypothetical protein n=1 Tax=Actinokineospora pegani TaxID=2654637 RepID=UPI0012E9B88C|nr:hypothetical protein [Actinokineospora pegani]
MRTLATTAALATTLFLGITAHAAADTTPIPSPAPTTTTTPPSTTDSNPWD